MTLPWIEVTVPTLEYVTSPQPYCGVETDDSTFTWLPTCTVCEHPDDEEVEVQAVDPAVTLGNQPRMYRQPTRVDPNS
jgi:hypothetical protein